MIIHQPKVFSMYKTVVLYYIYRFAEYRTSITVHIWKTNSHDICENKLEKRIFIYYYFKTL